MSAGPRDDQEPTPDTRTLIWDLPLRLFHWLLAGAVGVSLYTGINGGFEEMDWHQRSGFLVLGLITFRILWGFVGTRHARFASFVRGAGAVSQWLRTVVRRQPATTVGHNPLAGWTIAITLAALALQAATGLFASDDLFVEGPLVHLVSGDSVSLATRIHNYGKWVLGILVGLHLSAITLHTLVLREPLISAMVTGKRRGVAPDQGIQGSRLPLAGVLAVAVAAAVYWVVTEL